MNNKIIKSILSITMVSSMVVGGISLIDVGAETTKQNNFKVEGPSLVPAPQHVQYQDGNITITKTVNLKGQDVADPDAVRTLKTYLAANEITINNEYQEGSTTIILGEEDDVVDGLEETRAALGMVNAETLKDEGYVLGIDDANSGTVLIEGKDGDGTFYGVQTLMQLTSNENGNLVSKEVVIKDEPTMTTRGSIEGFYGTPWTHQDRLDQIRFYGENKLNTYIYAPKDDVYHREKWREAYPESEMTRMNELIKVSQENKVDFVFSLSPGNDIKFDGATAESDYQALINKCQAMYDMGVRSFAIFFDDISNKQGAKQAAFLNRFNTEFIQAKKDIKPLITVPTEYDTNAMSSGVQLNTYTKEFAATLDASIKVLWTGTAVVPEGIDVTNAQYVKSIYGDRIGIWWNYPVTDYIKDKLGLGPIYGLDKGLANELDFFVMNPMEHADLSKISIATGADYSWNTAEYDYDKSFVNSINNIYGELAPYMYTFANHSSRLVAGWASTGRADAPEVKAIMDALIKKVAKGQDGTAEIEALTAEFDAMIEAADKLKAEFTAEQLTHCSSNLNKLKALGENDKISLELLLAIRDKDDAKISSLKTTLNRNLSSLKSGSKVSEQTALAFINDVLNYDPNPTAGFSIDNTFVAPGQEVKFTNTSSISSTDLEWTFTGANIKTSTEESPVVTYAREGIYTVSLKAKNQLGTDEVIKEGIITVSNEAKGDSVNLALNKTATASGYTAASEAPGKAIDGISSTKWCTTNYGTKYLTIDLGKEVTVSNIIISHAEIGGEGSALNTQAYRLQVSNDGKDYTEVLKVTGNTQGLTNDPIPVRVARYVKLIIDNPTQGGDSAARIYEVEVMGLDKAIKLPDVYVPSDNKSILKIAIEEADKITEEQLDKVVPTVVKEFKAALTEAKTIFTDESATQLEVDNAFTRLSNAMQYLSFFKGDKTELSAFVAKIDALDKNAYLTSTWDILEPVYQEAKKVIADEDALVNDVNESYDKLVRAFLQLRLKPNKDLLDELIKNAEALNKADYTEATWSNLTKVLKDVKATFANSEATQEEVTVAENNLKGAIEKLEVIKVTPTNPETPNKPAETTKPTTKPNASKPGAAKTGDATSFAGVIGLGASLTAIALLAKKKKDNE